MEEEIWGMLVDLNVTDDEDERMRQREFIRFTNSHIDLHRPSENQTRLLYLIE